jgi:8-oxo-dGTP pyrophosphatase MutT (NUDIX family)
MQVEQREAARIIVLKQDRAVLLFQYARADGERFWATPGGGLEAGESFRRAATRELAEEVGIAADELEPLFGRMVEFTIESRFIRQLERYFLLRVEALDLAPHLIEEHRREGILCARWWSLDELRTSAEAIYPEGLASVLAHLFRRE